MKRLSLVLLAACMVFGILAGCAQKAKPAEYNLEALATQIKDSGAFSDILSPITKSIAASLFGFEDADVSDCVVYCSSGATTEEIALFKCANEEAATKLKANAEKRRDSQKAIYESYAPGEPPKLDDAIITQNGLYVFYIVSVDSSKVQAVLDKQNK